MKTAVGQQRKMPGMIESLFYPVLVAILVLAIPALLFTTNVRMVALDEGFYLRGWEKHGASQVTGLTPVQLRDVARAFIDYFQAPPGRMDVEVELGGARRPLFNQRELDHMEDVQALLSLGQRVQVLSALYVAAFVALGLAVFRERFLAGIGTYLLAGGGLTILAVLLIGIFAATDFTRFWTQFHLVSFRNDFWQLDPRRDYLIMLFPEGYWVDAVALLGKMLLAEVVAVGAAGLVLRRLL